MADDMHPQIDPHLVLDEESAQYLLCLWAMGGVFM